MDVSAQLYRVVMAYTHGWGLIVSASMYLWIAICLLVIARKLKVSGWWIAPLPVLNFYVMCATGKMQGRCFLWFLGPFIGIVVGGLLWIPVVILASLAVWAAVWIRVWGAICSNRGRPSWLGLLIVLPVMNLVLVGVLAFGD